MSSKDNDEERVIHSRSDKIEIVINDKVSEFVEDLFQSLLSRYQILLKTSIKGCDFIFDFVNLLYYKCHKTNAKRSKSYKDSLDWIKSKQQ